MSVPLKLIKPDAAPRFKEPAYFTPTNAHPTASSPIRELFMKRQIHGLLPLLSILLLVVGCISAPSQQALAQNADTHASSKSAVKTIPFPKPIELDPKQPGQVEDFILAGPDTTSVIISLTDPQPYRFPYWGGDKILQRYLKVITGQTVPIITPEQYEADTKYHGPSVYRIWMTNKVPQVEAQIGAILKDIDDDGFVIKSVGGHDLYIAGKQYWGTHFAPYDLLEKVADCRWYLFQVRFWMPEVDGNRAIGDVIPTVKMVKMPGNALIVEEPSYRARFYNRVPKHTYRLNRRDSFSHNLIHIFPVAKYGKTHPELYPLVDGKRFVPPLDKAGHFQPCISNPMTVDIAVEAASKAFDDGVSCFSLGMNDVNNFCECDKCDAMAPASIEGKNQRVAYAYAVWYNTIADRLKNKYPDKRLGTLAYASLSSLPPGSIKLDPMIVPYLTRDSAQLFDEREVKEFRELVDRWSNIASKMGIYEYAFGVGFYVPRLYNRYLLKNIQEGYGVEADGFYAECGPNWSLDGHKYWFMSKMLWNRQYDIPTLKTDFYNHMFGTASPAMRDYFEFLEETWCTQTLESNNSNYRWYYNTQQLAIFTPQKCDQALAYLQEARKQAAKDSNSEDVLKRINYFADGFEVTRQLALRYDANENIQKIVESKAPADAPELLKQFEAYLGLTSPDKVDEMRVKAGIGSFDSSAGFKLKWVTTSDYILALNTLVSKITWDIQQQWQGGSRADLNKLADQHLAKLDLTNKPRLTKLLNDIVKNRAIIFVRHLDKAPEIDGKIDVAQWGEPTFKGHLYRVYSDSEFSPHLTTIYAGATSDSPNVYLAMDNQSDTAAMAADVTDIKLDNTYPRKMSKDEAISVTRRYPKTGYYGGRINILGVGGERNGKNDRFQAELTKTNDGWQVEMQLVDGPLANRRPTIQTHLGIARYERQPVPVDKKGKPVANAKPSAICYTMMPVIAFGQTVGAGNFDSLMAFIWGPVLIYEKLPEPKEDTAVKK